MFVVGGDLALDRAAWEGNFPVRWMDVILLALLKLIASDQIEGLQIQLLDG